MFAGADWRVLDRVPATLRTGLDRLVRVWIGEAVSPSVEILAFVFHNTPECMGVRSSTSPAADDCLHRLAASRDVRPAQNAMIVNLGVYQ